MTQIIDKNLARARPRPVAPRPRRFPWVHAAMAVLVIACACVAVAGICGVVAAVQDASARQVAEWRSWR